MRLKNTQCGRSLFHGALLLAAVSGVAALLLCGCTAAKPSESPSDAKLVWPAPPEKARVAYVGCIRRPADAGVKLSRLKRVANWITGSEKGNEQLVKPFGIALDDEGNLCLTDTGANAVCYFDRKNNKWHRWEKIGKLPLLSPVAIMRANKTFYVADSTRASIVAFNDQGRLLFQITNKLERPTGLAAANGRLYVSDSKRHCIVVFDLQGRYQTEFGQRGNGPGQFNFPTHITADTQGNLFVTDSMNGRVQVLDNAGTFKRQFGGIGDSGGQFSRAKGVSVDGAGRIYVLDAMFDNLQIFDAEGRLLLTVGEPGAEAGKFWLPNGIATSQNNEVFVADSYNRRVQIFRCLEQS